NLRPRFTAVSWFSSGASAGWRSKATGYADCARFRADPRFLASPARVPESLSIPSPEIANHGHVTTGSARASRRAGSGRYRDFRIVGRGSGRAAAADLRHSGLLRPG